jgi:hypothetical protein
VCIHACWQHLHFSLCSPSSCRIGGILPNLFTEITTSKEKNMSAITLIDTPGLVDGDMQYPFDVEVRPGWVCVRAVCHLQQFC